MKPGNPMGEDMFERAREAFFGTAKSPPKPITSSTEFLKPRNEPSPEEVTAPFRDERRATQPVVFTRRNV